MGSGVDVTDLFRGSYPEGTGAGGQMLADSLGLAGFRKPTSIRFTSVQNERTIKALFDGKPIIDTVLGKAMETAVKARGGRITAWTAGLDEKGKVFLEASISY
jgi:hypothetical protein